MELTKEFQDQLYRLRELLNSNGHNDIEREIQTINTYEYKNIESKIQLLQYVISMCNPRALGDLMIQEMTYAGWWNMLAHIKEEAEHNLELLMESIAKIPLKDTIKYYDMDIDLRKNIIDWSVFENVVVLVMCNDELQPFNDNLAGFSYDGEMLWSTKDSLAITNRRGALFQVICYNEYPNRVCANTYIGINYTFDAYTGKVIDKMIVK